MTTQPGSYLTELEEKTNPELLDLAQRAGLEDGVALSVMTREQLLQRLLRAHADGQGVLLASGILETKNDGYGFLRQNGMPNPGQRDVYISQSQIRRFGLKTGDTVTGQVRPPKEGERYFGLVRVERVNGLDPDQIHARSRPQFEYLTPIFPEQQIELETDSTVLSTRMIDLFAPIGLGQRGLIVSPPKAGKTSILKEIAKYNYYRKS